MNQLPHIYHRTTARIIRSQQPHVNPKVLKFRKYLTLPRSDMDFLYSMKINPMQMRNTLKKFLKTRPIAFKTLQSYWLGDAGYICSHILSLRREEDKNQYVPVMTGKRKLYDFLKRCKNLESLKIYAENVSPTLLRSMRYLHQLKSLHLVLNSDQMQESPNIIRDLNRLRDVFIKVKRSQEDKSGKTSISEPIFPRICQHLLKLQYLEKIELDLQGLCNPDSLEVLESVLQHIGKSNLHFNIKICATLLNLENIKCILEKTDSLVLQCQKFRQNKQNHNKLEPERSRIIRQGHRVLHFISKETRELDFLPIIQACSSLQTLWIEAERHQTLLLKHFSFPKTLKNLFVVFPFLGSKEASMFLSYLIPALEHVETLEKLFFALSLQESVNQIDQLKDLNCIRNSTKYDLTVCFVPKSFIGQLFGNTLISLCSPITTMKSLKSLKLDFERTLVAPVEFIQRVLDSLPKKLEQFELVIPAYYGPKTFDLYFPFETLSLLTEFRLDLCNPLSTSAIYQFTKEFTKMKKLEVMVVKGACFLDPQFKLQEIVDGLKQMTKIRDLQVSIGQKESFSLKDYYLKIKTGKPELKKWEIRRFRSW